MSEEYAASIDPEDGTSTFLRNIAVCDYDITSSTVIMRISNAVRTSGLNFYPYFLKDCAPWSGLVKLVNALTMAVVFQVLTWCRRISTLRKSMQFPPPSAGPFS
jgi:hypothetical protein